MVKQVTMYEADDGSVHKHKADALRVNAAKELDRILRLKGLKLYDAQTILEHCHEVLRVLEPLAKELPLPVEMDDD